MIITKEIIFFNDNEQRFYCLIITDKNFDRLIELFSSLEGDEQPIDEKEVFDLCESYREITKEEADQIMSKASNEFGEQEFSLN